MVKFSEVKTKGSTVLKHHRAASKGRSPQTESAKIRCHDKLRPHERQRYCVVLSLLLRASQEDWFLFKS